MLIVKLLEAALRIFGSVGFDKSRHAVDSGLLGVLTLLGCCGARPRPRRSSRSLYRQNPPKSQTLNLTRPAPAYREYTPTSSGPPSVLRPEQVLQPYKEESDDETGYIMGAWQPFPGPGYSAVEAAPEQPKSGFARVGGGRAHYESPYAITNNSMRGSTQTFPSVERNPGPSSLSNAISPDDFFEPPSPSLGSAAISAYAKPVDPKLPPGAMPPGQPSHVRTKSQTAIVENAPLINLSGPPPSAYAGDSSAVDDTAANAPKKKWFNIRKNRRYSDADQLDMPPLPPEPEPGRSFVVVRKGKPGAPNKDASSSSEPTEERSFRVLRGPAASS
jgi:hypothetical protein